MIYSQINNLQNGYIIHGRGGGGARGEGEAQGFKNISKGLLGRKVDL